MAADAMATQGAMASAAMILTSYDKQVLAFHKEEFYRLPVFKKKNANHFLFQYENNTTCKGLIPDYIITYDPC